MKKSLRQMLLVGLSATMLAGIAVPVALAQEDTTEETTEQVEETMEEETTEEETTEETADGETTEEETTEEGTEAEASEVQQGVDEALAIYEEEYPDSVIEEIEVDLDLEETIYTIFVRGFDVDNNDYELELEWADGEVQEQQFNEGWFNFGGEDDSTGGPATNEQVEETETVEGDLPTTETGGDDDVTELAEEEVAETGNEGPMDPAETTEEGAATEDAPVEEQLDEEQQRLVLELDNLLTIDEASEIALQEAGSGEIDHWNLSADTSEWWDLFGDEENENPVWTINVVNMEEDSEGMIGDGGLEIRIDAVTGEVINPEDIEEETAEDGETTEETIEETTEAMDTETEVEETIEETVEETEEAE